MAAARDAAEGIMAAPGRTRPQGRRDGRRQSFGRRCPARRPRKWKFRQRPSGTGDRLCRPLPPPVVRFQAQARKGSGRSFPQPLPWWTPAGDGAGGTVGVGSHLAGSESENFDKDPMERGTGRKGPVRDAGAGVDGAGGNGGAGAHLADCESGNFDKDPTERGTGNGARGAGSRPGRGRQPNWWNYG